MNTHQSTLRLFNLFMRESQPKPDMPTCGILRDFERKSPAKARIFFKKVGLIRCFGSFMPLKGSRISRSGNKPKIPD